MPKRSFTKDDIRKFAEEENVRYLRLQFTDILGTIKNVEVPVSQLEKVLDNEMMFDGCLLYTSPSPRDKRQSRMPSSA